MPRIGNTLPPSPSQRSFKKKNYRPWNLLDDLQQSSAKPDTNRTQTKHETEHKPNTNRTQTEHRKNINLTQTEHEPSTKSDTDWSTNRAQTGHKPDTNHCFSTLVGLQRKTLLFLYENCKATRSKITEPLTLEHLSNQLNIRIGSVKTTIRRLQIKSFIKRLDFKNGRSGWSKYEVPSNLFSELLQLETQHKLNTKWTQTEHKADTELDTKPNTTMPSSSGILNILKETTTGDGNKNSFNQDIPENWRLDIEPLQQIGFTQTHLKQIASQNKLSPQLVQDSIYGFAFDIENNDKLKKINKDPISYFMGIVRTGQVYTFSSNYESPQDKAMRLHLERTRELERKRREVEKEAFDLDFRAWFSELSDAQKRELLPEKMRGGAKLEKNIFLETSARSKFETEIWPTKRKEITGYETTSKEEVTEEQEKKK